MEHGALALASLAATAAFGADALLTPHIESRRWRERLTNVSCGVARYAVHGLVHGVFLGAYAALLAASPLALPAASPQTWLLGFLAFDFLIFVTHWLAHRVPLLWAIHSVHHQPEEIDVTVGLRTHVLTSLFYLPLLLPLAALGLPLAVFLPLGTLRLAAMALTHTRLRTPSWLDPFLNTPELHAIHHSTDPRHFDKNIGGILMLWDHLLGSYLTREAVARCGLPGPQARNALEANWLPFRSLAPRSLRWIAAALVLAVAGCATGLGSHGTEVLWRVKLVESGSQPVLADGVLYVGSGDGAVHAFDAATGRARWRFETGQSIPAGPMVVDVPPGADKMLAISDAVEDMRRRGYPRVDMTPAVENGTVFVGSGDNSFYAIDAATGRMKWSYAAGPGMTVGRTFTIPPAVLANGAVYFTSDLGLHAVDALTGHRRWLFETLQEAPPRKYQPAKRPPTGCVVGDDAIFVTDWSGFHGEPGQKSFAYAVDPKSGKAKWVVSVAGANISEPILAKGLLLFSIRDESPSVLSDRFTLYAIDAASGRVQWESGVRMDSHPRLRVGGNTLLIQTDEILMAFDVETGRERWSFHAEELSVVPEADDRHAYVVTHEGSMFRTKDTLHALDLSSGQEKWSTPSNDAALVALTQGGVVYLNGKRLQAIDAATGQVLWSFEGRGLASALLVSGDRIFLTTPTVQYIGTNRVDQGYLYAIDARREGRGTETFSGSTD